MELLRDYAPSRRFGNVGMELFNLQEYDPASVLQAVLDKGTTKYQLTYDDRALLFIRTFVEAREKRTILKCRQRMPGFPDRRRDASGERNHGLRYTATALRFSADYRPFSRSIVSLEALMRSAEGGSPRACLTQPDREAAYEIDLKSKKQAFALAKNLASMG